MSDLIIHDTFVILESAAFGTPRLSVEFYEGKAQVLEVDPIQMLQ